MSQFVKTLNHYCRSYQVNLVDRGKLLAHYPLFKMAWYAWWGKGMKKSLSHEILKAFKGYRFTHFVAAATAEGGRKIPVPVLFDEIDVQSFAEIFWGDTYLSASQPKNAATLVDLGGNTGMT